MSDLPKKLGKYEIRRVIGRGAMGLVCEGYDPIIDRVVAIKTIKKEGLDTDQLDDYLQRFRSEARAAGRLQHSHIVTIYDFGEDGDVHYIVMELIHGRDLKSYFAVQHPFSLAQVGKLMGELLAALHYSHSRGVIHRDVKPDNVFITTEGSVKLGDFGIARIDASQRTHAGKLVGTPSYMAPEQIRGEPVDARSDVYSAGVILYQFLVGERPFTGGNMMAVMQKVLMEAPKLPSVHNPTLPSVIDDVVMRALAKRAADRFASALEFSRDLTWAIGLASEDVGEKTQIAPLDISTLPPLPEPTHPSIPSATGGVIVKPPTHASRLEEKKRERQRLEVKAAEWLTLTQALLEESTRLQGACEAGVAQGRLLLDGEAMRRAAEDWAARGSTASDAVRRFVGSGDLLTLESQEALEERAATLDATVAEQQATSERLGREAAAAQGGIEQGLRVVDRRLAGHDETWAALEGGLDALDAQAGESPPEDVPARIAAITQNLEQMAQSVAGVRRQTLQLPAALDDRLAEVEARLETQRARGVAMRRRHDAALHVATQAAQARRLAEETQRREEQARQLAEEARQREEAARREAEARALAQAGQRDAQTSALLEESGRLVAADAALRREGRLLLDGAAQERAAEAWAARLRSAQAELAAWLDAESALPAPARETSLARAQALAEAAGIQLRAVQQLRDDAESARTACKQRLRALEKQLSGHGTAWALEEAAVRGLDAAAGEAAVVDAQSRTAALERDMDALGAACQAWRTQALQLPPALLERVDALEARLDVERGRAARVRGDLEALRQRIDAARTLRQQQTEEAKRRARAEEQRRQAQAEQERVEGEAAAALRQRALDEERRAEAARKQEEAARLRAEALRRQQQEDQLRAEALQRQQEEDRLRAEALQRQQEEDRLRAEALQRQEDEERRRAEALALQEQERLRAEARERQQREERQQAEARRQEEEAAQRRAAEAALARAAAELARQQASQARERAQPWIDTLDGMLGEIQALVAAADAVMTEGRLLVDGGACREAAAALAARARAACDEARQAAKDVEPLLPDLARALEARWQSLLEAVAAQQAWVDRLRREEQAAQSAIDQRLRGLERQALASETALADAPKAPALVVPDDEERTAPHRPQSARAARPAAAGRRLPWVPIGAGVAAVVAVAAVVVPRFARSPDVPAVIAARSAEGAASANVGSASSTSPAEGPAAAHPDTSMGGGAPTDAVPVGKPSETTAANGARIPAGAGVPAHEARGEPPANPPVAPTRRADVAAPDKMALSATTTTPPPQTTSNTPPPAASTTPPTATTNAPDAVKPGAERTTAEDTKGTGASASTAATAPTSAPATTGSTGEPAGPTAAPPVSNGASSAPIQVALAGADDIPRPAERTPKESFDRAYQSYKNGRKRGLEEMQSAVNAGYREGKAKVCELIAARGHASYNEEVFCKPQTP